MFTILLRRPQEDHVSRDPLVLGGEERPLLCTQPRTRVQRLPQPHREQQRHKEDSFVSLELGIQFALNPELASLQNSKCRIITGASSH